MSKTQFILVAVLIWVAAMTASIFITGWLVESLEKSLYLHAGHAVLTVTVLYGKYKSANIKAKGSND